LGRIFLIS